jgi:flagellar FliL protein
MSEEAAEAKPKKKGGMKKMLVISIGALVLIGGGVGAGLYAAGSGLVGGGHEGPKEDPTKPKLVAKSGPEGEGIKVPITTGKGLGDEKFDRSKFQATYYPIENPFTSNLRDSDGFMQLGIGVATYYDERVLEHLKNNEMPVRSAVLMTLADQDGFVISTPEGKKELQKELKDAINQVLVSREGFGGIDDVYFTSFIIQ